MRKIKVASIQMVSGISPEENMARVSELVAQAAAQQADWVVLPEYWPILGRQDGDKIAIAEKFGEGRLQALLSELAVRHQVVVFGGTVPLISHEAGKVLNSLLVFDREGCCVGRYDKVHLFGYSGLGERYAEADTITAGCNIPHVQIDGWGVALGVCYDLRFPEFFRAQQPFEVMVLPAAFTYTTGKAHWSLLLKARAVENQCFVVASAQGGRHENGRSTFGHSMVIDPWGEELAVLPEGEGVVLAELDGNRVQSVRSRLPALAHRVF